jgi:hypothetical protein
MRYATSPPFGYRVLTAIATYVKDASALGVEWQPAVDQQLLQKVLPKVTGADPRIGGALEQLFAALMADGFPLSNKTARRPAGRRSAAPTPFPSVCGAPSWASSGPPGDPTSGVISDQPWPGRVSSAWSTMLTDLSRSARAAERGAPRLGAQRDRRHSADVVVLDRAGWKLYETHGAGHWSLLGRPVRRVPNARQTERK